jgi:Ca2+-binding RTX toxin-like protein
MPNFTSQTAVNLTGLDLFSGFSKISVATVSAIAGGFRIQLSATETVEVTGSFSFAGTVPIGGTVNGIQLSVSGTPIIQLLDIAVPWANAIAYCASQAAALAAWPILLAGADTLTGSSFADTLIGYGGADTINGGGGLDTVLYTDKTTSVMVALNGATAATVTVNGVAEDTLTNIENVTGGSGNDTLTGDAQANVLIGGAGDDTLTGAGGVDVLDGGDGADTAVFSEKSDTLFIALNGAANTTVKVGVGGADEDVLRNIENVVGGSAGDILIGDLLANLLDGGAGNDVLVGGAGKDTLDGGTGIDTALFSDKTLGLSITLNGATNALMVIAGQGEDTLRNVENVTGGSGTDTLTGDTLANILDGGLGNDTLTGAGGLDTLDGGAGIDTALFAEKSVAIQVTLNGAADATVIVAGAAEDTIRNIENFIAGSAADTLIGDSLANLLDSGSGDDTISGGGGDDMLSGRAGLDSLDGGGGVDTASYAEKTASVTVTLNGATDSIVKIGGQDEDTLRNVENLIGGSGGDLLTGDDLANLLSGGQGNDVLDGRGGRTSSMAAWAAIPRCSPTRRSRWWRP